MFPIWNLNSHVWPCQKWRTRKENSLREWDTWESNGIVILVILEVTSPIMLLKKHVDSTVDYSIKLHTLLHRTKVSWPAKYRGNISSWIFPSLLSALRHSLQLLFHAFIALSTLCFVLIHVFSPPLSCHCLFTSCVRINLTCWPVSFLNDLGSVQLKALLHLCPQSHVPVSLCASDASLLWLRFTATSSQHSYWI